VVANAENLEVSGVGAGMSGVGVVTSSAGVRLGVVNVAGCSAIAGVSAPLEAIERQLEGLLAGERVDTVLVDVHGESVFEKLGLAYALSGSIAALLGTHTHVQTRDARVLPGGVAYVSDVGMTGPSGGMQGYGSAGFVARLLSPGLRRQPLELATGDVELGAVLVTFKGSRASEIRRLE